MTLREVGDWIIGLVAAVGRDVETIRTESILDWPLYMVIVIGLLLLFTLGLAIATTEKADAWYRQKVHPDGLIDAVQLFVLSFLVWLFAASVTVAVLFAARASDAWLALALVIPTLSVAVLLVLIFKGRSVKRQERECISEE